MAQPYTKQIRPVVEPASIHGLTNGQFPADRLAPIYEHGDTALKVVGHMAPEAARAWNAMVAHAWRDGIDIRPTSEVDSYRPRSVQDAIFADRYRTTDQGNGSRVCNGRRWWKRKGVASAACPGTSNHGRALACDVANCSGARLAWLEAHAWTYGFSWELAEEAWHIRYCTGDAIPAAVLAHEAGLPDQPDHPAPTEDDDMPLLINAPGAAYLLDGGRMAHLEADTAQVFKDAGVKEINLRDNQAAVTKLLRDFPPGILIRKGDTSAANEVGALVEIIGRGVKAGEGAEVAG